MRTKLLLESIKFSNSRRNMTRNWVGVLVSIISPVIIAILIAAMIGYDPGTLFTSLFSKAFLDYKVLIFNFVVLGLCSLSFIFAFKVGLFNIGMVGQMMSAGFVCLLIAYNLKDVNFPNGLSQIFMILIAIITASLVGVIISALKIFLKVNEVVSSILLNWILYFFIKIMLRNHLSESTGGSPATSSFDFPQVFTLNNCSVGGWLPALIIFIILVIGVWVLFKYTVFGKKIISVGSSMSASKYLGYNTKVLLMSSMGISAAIAGILGYVLYTSGVSNSIPISSSSDVLPSEGMNGIAIGLIALGHPIAIVPVSFLISMFQTSAPYLEVPSSFSNFIIGLIILGSTFFVVIIKYKPWIWLISKIKKIDIKENLKNKENALDKLVSKYKSYVLSLNTQKKKINKQLKHESNQIIKEELQIKILQINLELQELNIKFENEKELIKVNYIKDNFVLGFKKKILPSIFLEEEKNKEIKNYNSTTNGLVKFVPKNKKEKFLEKSHNRVVQYSEEIEKEILNKENSIKENLNQIYFETRILVENTDLKEEHKELILNEIKKIYLTKKQEIN